MGIIIEKLGFPIGVSLILLGIIWWMIKNLTWELGSLRKAIDKLEGGIASLRGLIACWLMQNGSDVTKAITMVNNESPKCKRGDDRDES
ncbi:MAG: hypothetical protein J7M18_08820 [Candidatus Eremiobacteraeota bacterium]|nr:hypothetical protein [Candidatus Eremiobacteraeota bacterium]